jgi:hypothetical protein
MAETINTGTVLIKDGAFLPSALRFESEPCTIGWRLVKNLDGFGLSAKIQEAGWTFFWLAGELRATVFGFNQQRSARRAVKRILAELKWGGSNSLEISRVASKRFLGLPYTSVSAHSRHIQENGFLLQVKDTRSGTEQN